MIDVDTLEQIISDFEGNVHSTEFAKELKKHIEKNISARAPQVMEITAKSSFPDIEITEEAIEIERARDMEALAKARAPQVDEAPSYEYLPGDKPTSLNEALDILLRVKENIRKNDPTYSYEAISKVCCIFKKHISVIGTTIVDENMFMGELQPERAKISPRDRSIFDRGILTAYNFLRPYLRTPEIPKPLIYDEKTNTVRPLMPDKAATIEKMARGIALENSFKPQALAKAAYEAEHGE